MQIQAYSLKVMFVLSAYIHEQEKLNLNIIANVTEVKKRMKGAVTARLLWSHGFGPSKSTGFGSSKSTICSTSFQTMDLLQQ